MSALTLVATLAVLGCADAWAAAEQASAPTHDSPPAKQALQEVTVTAQHARLAKRVSKFVDQVAGQGQNEEGLPLWHVPVCPSVTGITGQQGEFLLWRISEIARGAGVPLAGENCRSNLFVFVTAEPTKLIQAMDTQKRAVTFGNSTSRLSVDEFIARAQPVRVWYKSRELTPEYATPNYGLPGDHPCTSADIIGAGIKAPTICDSERSSRVEASLVSVFSYVYVIVDSKRLQGVTWRQLADYVGVVGLAKIKPAARLGDTPTILRLFDGTPQAAPAAMTDWDRAFLKSLYATEQRLKQQRNQVANTMVEQLEH